MKSPYSTVTKRQCQVFTVRVSPLLINFMVLTVGYTLIFSRYLCEHNKWTRGVHKDGDTCNHVNNSSTIGTEEEDMCADCMSGSPSSGGSSQIANGKGKKKKGKNKDKKVFSSLLSDGCLVCLCHVTQLSVVPLCAANVPFLFWLMYVWRLGTTLIMTFRVVGHISCRRTHFMSSGTFRVVVLLSSCRRVLRFVAIQHSRPSLCSSSSSLRFVVH